MENKIEIPLSKLKIGLLFIGSIIFVLIGVQFAISPEESTTARRSSPLFIRIIGIISILFFGICGISIGRKLFDRKIEDILRNYVFLCLLK